MEYLIMATVTLICTYAACLWMSMDKRIDYPKFFTMLIVMAWGAACSAVNFSAWMFDF